MVKISDKLWAGKFEVTQKEYQKVAGSNPSQFPADNNPVDSVSWSAALSFCAQLTEAEDKEKLLPEGMAYTLPTQAQWESFAAGVDLKDAVTGSGARRSGTSAVGSLGASGLGLYDVRGNVWEWCLDPQDKPFRVARGAAWDTFIEVNLRPEFRWYSNGPDDSKNSIGFRCVLAPADK
jgi:formylglycine-generating enzyme required for sulfatase activity